MSPRVLILAAGLLAGCATLDLTQEERRTLARLEAAGLRRTEAGTTLPADVALANAWGPLALLFGPDLDVFPCGGAGNFHLALRAGAIEDTRQFWLGLLNAVTWPLSPLWSVPQVIADARLRNEKETAFFFTHTYRGYSALAAREASRGPPEGTAPARPGTRPEPRAAAGPPGGKK